MTKKYGGITGPKVEPTSSSAFGVWNAPTEVYRELTGSDWPESNLFNFPSIAGSYVFAISSGVADTASSTGSFTIASGGLLLISSYPTLYSRLGTTFGGDGITTFGYPNLFDKFVYLKGTTTSGTTVLTGSGVIGSATHNHTFTRYTGNSVSANTTTGNVRANMAGSANVQSSFDGEENCEMRKRECIPLFATRDSRIPVGAVFPVLWPNITTSFSVLDPNVAMVASGQAISRTTYSGLYTLVGDLYGSGNGSTTFTLPDYRGIFISGPRQPVSVKQPSGVISPSGFLPSAFARHAHIFPANVTSFQNADSSGPTTFGTTTIAPASSTFAGNTNESRGANISVIWCLAVG